MTWTFEPSYIGRVGWRAVGAFQRLTFRSSGYMTLENARAWRSSSDFFV